MTVNVDECVLEAISVRLGSYDQSTRRARGGFANNPGGFFPLSHFERMNDLMRRSATIVVLSATAPTFFSLQRIYLAVFNVIREDFRKGL